MATAVDIERPEAEGANAGTARLAVSRPVRVCFLIDRLATGGTETQLLALIHNLDREVVQPYLVLLDGEDGASRSFEPADCHVLRLGVKKLLAPHAALSIVRFLQFLRREQIDVLQLYFPDSSYFGAIAGRLARVRAIVRTRNNINHWMTPTHRRLGRILNRLVTATVCNSEAARQAVLADERSDPDTVDVIENGVDLDRFAHISTVGTEHATGRFKRVGMVANLRPVKGVDVFLRAAAILAKEHPDATFHVAGEGPQRPELERLVDELGLSGRSILHGRVDDIPAFLAGLDVAVLSSRAEGLPNAVLEYMAAGRPIVATAVGGVSGIVSHGVHAWLVPPESPESIAGAMTVLLNDPLKAARLARAARQHVRERFSRAVMVDHFHDLYRGIVPGSSPRRLSAGLS